LEIIRNNYTADKFLKIKSLNLGQHMTTSPTKSTRFEPDAGWAKVPHGLWLREATSVAVDSADNVYIFNRGNMPVITFDVNGNLINKWGTDNSPNDVVILEDAYGNRMQYWNNWFTRAHAITVDFEDNLWLVDDSGNQIHKMSPNGEFLMTIGTNGTTHGKPPTTGEASLRQSGEMFNRPTDVAISKSSGDIFISDGYGNSRIHRLDHEGKHILSFGESGTEPGQFNLPHNLALLDDTEIVVCDRENNRIQVFSIDGKYSREWMAHKAVAVEVVGSGDDARIYVAEQGPAPVQRGVARIGNCVRIYDRHGNQIIRFGSDYLGENPDQFLWPHSLAIDSNGSIYVAEVSYTEVGRRLNPPKEMPSIRKWRKKS
jgi:DNA-binding beta-propeller fold protein YncE|tara:strand:+ start:3093 stop:4208 length:1116 start_codon:yes stop_codon:yes gene_type:complete